MIFRNYSQVAADVREWSRRLPQNIICVAGVPRSGAVIGSMLAHYRGVTYCDANRIVHGEKPWEHGAKRQIPPLDEGIVLFVDDTSWTGTTYKHLQSHLRGVEWPRGVSHEFASLYASEAAQELTGGLCGRLMPHERHGFEWNIFSIRATENIVSDLDDVICGGPAGIDERKDPDAYREWVPAAVPLQLPTRRLRAIVTGRLRLHHSATADWLMRHRVEYSKLFTSPAGDCASRRVASEKVQTIAGLIREGGPIGLYVDDDGRNCHQIFRETGTPVLNWSTMEGEGIEEPGTWYNPVRPDGGPMIIDRSWPAAKVNSGNRFFG